jgi:hypothetical protein
MSEDILVVMNKAKVHVRGGASSWNSLWPSAHIPNSKIPKPNLLTLSGLPQIGTSLSNYLIFSQCVLLSFPNLYYLTFCNVLEYLNI